MKVIPKTIICFSAMSVPYEGYSKNDYLFFDNECSTLIAEKQIIKKYQKGINRIPKIG
jgi:hypothetical protein